MHGKTIVENSAKKDMLDFFQMIWREGDVREIRVFESPTKNFARKLNGYFSSPEAATSALIENYNIERSFYATLNPVSPMLLHQKDKNNKLSKMITGCKDANVTSLDYILIDCDVQKEVADIASTNKEIGEARKIADKIIEALGEPIMLNMSGNGWHMIYPHNANENNLDNKQRVKKFLNQCHERFSTDLVAVDTSVFNPSRILKIPGTWANKGNNTPERPYRLSRIECEYTETTMIDVAGIDISTKKKTTIHRDHSGGSFNSSRYVEEFLHKNSVHIKKHKCEPGGKEVFVLDECVFNPDHKKDDAAIIVQGDGVIGYHCFHNSCSNKIWSDVREVYEPGYKDKRRGDYQAPHAQVNETNAFTHPGGFGSKQYETSEEDYSSIEKETQKLLAKSAKAKSSKERYDIFPLEKMHPVGRGYIKECMPMTDAPIEFMYASFVSSSSAFLQNRVHLNFVGKLYPNTYTLIIGRSTLFRKSTSMKVGTLVVKSIDKKDKESYLHDYRIFKRQWEEYLNNRNASELDEPREPMDHSIIMPQQVTPEYFLKKMSKGSGAGYILLSEMGTLLESSTKSYMKGYKELLTETYDCSPYYKGTISQDDCMVEIPCPSILGASTIQWMRPSMNESELKSGFLSRFIIIVKEELDRETIYIPEQLEISSWWEECFYPRLRGVTGEFRMSEGAKEVFIDFCKKNKELRLKNDSFLEAFYGRSEAMVLKVALTFHCMDVACGYVALDESKPILEHERHLISKEAMEYSVHYINHSNTCITNNIDNLTGGNTDDVDKVFSAIEAMYRSEPEKITDKNGIQIKAVKMRDVNRKVRKKAKDMHEIMETLSMQDRIRLVKKGKSLYVIPIE